MEKYFPIISMVIELIAWGLSIACMIMGLSDLDRNKGLGRFSKFIWLLWIMTIPVFGAVLYFMFGSAKQDKAAA